LTVPFLISLTGFVLGYHHFITRSTTAQAAIHAFVSTRNCECVDAFAPSTNRVTHPTSWHHERDDLVLVVFCDVLLQDIPLFLSCNFRSSVWRMVADQFL
jgi:hypothetical protein